AWLAQRVLDRDLTCRFPGCERPIRQLHHVTWWSKGGETNSDSLGGMCWTDHGHMHKGGWNATGNADGELIFTSPRGRSFVSRARPEWTPPRRTPAIRHQIVMHLAPRALAVDHGCDDGDDDGDDHGCDCDSADAS
ncbi:MAG TPA: hypothetical protein VK866_16650, partial [Acidimicrobiales bacterium]|nr:hypothetical protein [Acidimicrobiales bacterium]